jgi:hypothetical protein
MQQGLRKAQTYQWISRDFSQVLAAQEIGAGRVKNRLIWVVLLIMIFYNKFIWGERYLRFLNRRKNHFSQISNKSFFMVL